MVRATGVRRSVPLAVTVVLALATLALVPIASSSATTGCSYPPPTVPVAELQRGTVGVGYTVFEGTEPEPFDVEVIGVLPDGISVGLDMILVQVSGAAIDEIGGIASGFSGSPVYVDGILAGAISYGFWYGDPTIGGMTPAEPLVEILTYPGTGGLSSAASAAMAPPERVRLDARTSRAVARAANLSPDVGGVTLRRLMLPLSASGVGERGLQKLQARFDRKGLPFVPYVGSSARRPTAATLATEPLGPGDSFAAVISYGDVTYGAVGTATAVCGDRVVAFAHPFNFAGSVDDLAMNGANVLTVVTDPSKAYGPFKVAILAEPHGLIDQDRMAGVRGVERLLPPTTTIRTQTSSLDTGRTRIGSTYIVKRDDWLRWVAWDHVWMNIDRTWDQVGPGMLAMDWTIRGVRASGAPFELTRSNMYWSDWDNSWDNTEEFNYHLYALQQNRFEDVEITGIDAVVMATEERHEARIKKVLTASSLLPDLRRHDPLLVTPGETIAVRVMLLPLGADVPVPVDLQVRIPSRALAGRGYLSVRGGETDEWGVRAASFDQLLTRLANQERNCDIVATLSVRGAGRKGLRFDEDQIIVGRRTVMLRVVRSATS